MNDNINMDSTIAGSVNDNINMDSTIAGSVNTSIGLCFLKLRPLYIIYDPCSSTFEMGSKGEKIKLLQKIEFRMTQHCATIFVPINDPCSIEFNILDNNI